MVNSVKAGNLASDVAFSADGKSAYVASGEVYRIDCASQTIVGSGIDVGFRAYAVAVAD